jgi:hypothetical protein
MVSYTLHQCLSRLFVMAVATLVYLPIFLSAQSIPLPEHPRPDYERPDWVNLNGTWAFEFDKNGQGVAQKWMNGARKFSKTIQVPFPWGSPLSGVADEADIAWYQHEIKVPAAWKGKRTFLTIGASDWETTVYLDGKELGKHQGGYTPFSLDLTPLLKYDSPQRLSIRVDDKRREFTLYGKQGYGNARGIWQTIYLEARGQNYLDALHFSPDIDNQKVSVTAYLPAPTANELQLNLKIAGKTSSHKIAAGSSSLTFDVSIPNQHLWTLDDPFLYDVEAQLSDGKNAPDVLKSYFGMRKISVVDLPGTAYPYIALNNEPIYLQLTLDQSYHPEGFYTFPSDEFMKEEILLARGIGLNGIRTHIKVDIPRKLYWADKLGVLVMSDLPNFWGEPDASARKESDYTLREMIKRDYNHPAIFSWITFNETWGLSTAVEENGKKQNKYLPETQQWVVSMYKLAKQLDPTRLVEDNSICCGRGHTETDINSWHEYLPGWAWEEHLKNIDANTFPGSKNHMEAGYTQGRQPNINSECGNVWGYDGSTGDVDWSWDYHRMMNTFRKYPKVAGWLYTEHHDVINEWNGYWKFDRTNKFTGLEEMADGMSIKDLHSMIYISTGNEISKTVQPGESVKIPLYASFYTNRTDLGKTLTLQIKLSGYDALGQKKTWMTTQRSVPYTPWMQKQLDSLRLQLPNEKCMANLSLTLQDALGNDLHHNVISFVVETPAPANMTLSNGKLAQVLTVAPKDFSAAKWSKKQWNVLDGLKVNGAGSGFFEYTFKMANKPTGNESATFIAELGAKQLFVKDYDKATNVNVDYMLGGRVDPSSNPNAYPMTDEYLAPSTVNVTVNGIFAGRVDLADDPADHRGVLSWHYQPKVRKLQEAGSYGYRVAVNIPPQALNIAKVSGELIVRLEVPESMPGGLAVYGDKFGRYPMNPTVVLVKE